MKRNRSLLSLLTERFPQKSRDELFSLILCGDVSVDGSKIRDPKSEVPRDAYISIERRRFVSRGGDKLDHALSVFGIDVRGKVVIDAGSSTGGFTDCLLQRGAVAVHAVDVGFNLLAYALRNDPRVILHERTGVMDIRGFLPQAHIATADLSFRSIRGAASHLISQTIDHKLVALIKPQFEWRNPPSSFDGVLRDSKASAEFFFSCRGLKKRGSIYSRLYLQPYLAGRETGSFSSPPGY
jgi:23S rRNA (cytidine1920-2'-O)/16S rRNA (cytidine1409-2'-O)-methyltransferase